MLGALFGVAILLSGREQGALFGVAILLFGRASRKQPIPFGPFMIAGAVLAVLAWPA